MKRIKHSSPGVFIYCFDANNASINNSICNPRVPHSLVSNKIFLQNYKALNRLNSGHSFLGFSSFNSSTFELRNKILSPTVNSNQFKILSTKFWSKAVCDTYNAVFCFYQNLTQTFTKIKWPYIASGIGFFLYRITVNNTNNLI